MPYKYRRVYKRIDGWKQAGQDQKNYLRKDLEKQYLKYAEEDQLLQVLMIGLALDLKELDDFFFCYKHKAQMREYLIVLPLFMNQECLVQVEYDFRYFH